MSIAAVLLAMLCMPFLIARMMDRDREKQRKRPSGMGFEGAFDVLDPSRARAVQTIQIHQEVGQTDTGDQGELVDGELVDGEPVDEPLASRPGAMRP